jgi:methionyl-tRNA formyltransferase|tara:strand:+ start:31 stop:624 length:594 start_codon:yes stop_codon:yes gene_type:complete
MNKLAKVKIVFLGYNIRKTKLINFLKKKSYPVTPLGQKKLSSIYLEKDIQIISFGYKNIISKKILEKIKRPPINLHISYLPFNKGSHPNFWSFVDKTPKGVTIHEIDKGIDTGKIIFQKKIYFKDFQNLTFKKTHLKLINEIEKLFIKNYKKLINNKYKTKLTRKKGTYHNKSDLPEGLKSWNTKIGDYLNLNKKKF